MKKLLLFALAVVSTLACIAPADAQIPKNKNGGYCQNASLTENTRNHGNTQCSNRTVQSEKSNGMVSSATNQSTIPNDKVIAAKLINRGTPRGSVPAGRRGR